MSAADRKGYLRRWKMMKREGHTPKKTSLSASQSIERQKAESKALADHYARQITARRPA